jgi:hypothetical protein
VKSTDKWHGDFHPLQKAEAEMNRVGKLVNEFMKEKDNVKKLFELANRMNGFPVRISFTFGFGFRLDLVSVLVLASFFG